MDSNTQAISYREDGMKQILEAAISGDATKLPDSVLGNPEILLSKTAPEGGTCLHISSAFGHEQFSKAVVSLNPSLLTAANSYRETALIVAITSGRVAVALTILTLCKENNETGAILANDDDGNNALHHAICNGHTDIALELIKAEPALSEGVNKYGESPMFLAVMRGFTKLLKQLLEIPGSSTEGGNENNVLHAAATTGDQEITKTIMTKRPMLAQKENKFGNTPLREAMIRDQLVVVHVLLQLDRSLGYHISKKDGLPLLFFAAHNGNVGVAKELLKYCPDAPYRASQSLKESNTEVVSQPPEDPKHPYRAPVGMTCLHVAVTQGHIGFVKFILRSPSLHKLINVQDSNGKTALHYAVEQQNPNIVRVFLDCKDINIRVHEHEVFALISEADHQVHSEAHHQQRVEEVTKADPEERSEAYHQRQVEEVTEADHQKCSNAYCQQRVEEVTKADPQKCSKACCQQRVEEVTKADSQEDSKAYRQRLVNEFKEFDSNLAKSLIDSMSVVATLIATITFAAGFTLPGGYSSNAENEGLPVFARKAAFKAFVIFDTIAMCISLAVAFLCINARIKTNNDHLWYNVIFISMMMTWSYLATTLAFGTGLYTVLAPRVPQLAIAVCVLSVVFPTLISYLGELPALKKLCSRVSRLCCRCGHSI